MVKGEVVGVDFLPDLTRDGEEGRARLEMDVHVGSGDVCVGSSDVHVGSGVCLCREERMT